MDGAQFHGFSKIRDVPEFRFSGCDDGSSASCTPMDSTFVRMMPMAATVTPTTNGSSRGDGRGNVGRRNDGRRKHGRSRNDGRWNDGRWNDGRCNDGRCNDGRWTKRANLRTESAFVAVTRLPTLPSGGDTSFTAASARPVKHGPTFRSTVLTRRPRRGQGRQRCILMGTQLVGRQLLVC